MKKVGNFIFIFFLLLMCAATAFETISQLKCRLQQDLSCLN